MQMKQWCSNIVVGAGSICLSFAWLAAAEAQDAPVRGGSLSITLIAEPANYDCHAGIVSPGLATMAPVYSLLLKYNTEKFPEIVGDVAESWSVSADGLTYTFKLRPNIRFHDGTSFGAEDVKATYERLCNPPTGVVSIRRSMFSDIASIEAADPLTVVFKLTQPNPGMLTVFANPWNCLYSEARLKEDPTFPANNMMGTGPFKFVDRVAGSSWAYERFDGYFRSGHPYLDAIKLITVAPPAVVSALASGQVDAMLYSVSDALREQIAKARGDKTAFQKTRATSYSLMTFNMKKKPFDDVRVRKALTLAIDRRVGDANLRKLISIDGYGAVVRPDTPYELPAADTAKLVGLGGDIVAARAEAKRLLAEAGVPNLRFTLLNPNVKEPWESIGIYVVDSWRQIGVTVEQNIADLPTYTGALRSGQFDVTSDFNAPVQR